MLELIFKMLVGHAIADFALQNDFMAKNKKRSLNPIWTYVLGSHALIQGGFVFWATNNVTLGIAETFVHAVIDYGKCEEKYGIHTDQGLHFASKLVWAYLLMKGLV